MSRIRESLNGIGRVVEYGVSCGSTSESTSLDHAIQSNNFNELKIFSVIEGELKQGHFDGFARALDANGNC